MEQVTSERAKWISRTLAAVVFLIAVRIAFGLVKYLFTTGFTLSAGVILFEVVFIVFMVAACSFFIWLAMQFWARLEPAHIRFLAFIPAFWVFGVTNIGIRDWEQHLIRSFWPDVEAVRSLPGMGIFWGLLAGGIVYLWTKRLLFQLLEQTELINPLSFRRARKQYFGWLALSFWIAMFSIFQLLDELEYLDPGEVWRASFFSLFGSLITAIIFYRLCVKCFVNRPLKRLQPKSTRSRLRSQP